MISLAACKHAARLRGHARVEGGAGSRAKVTVLRVICILCLKLLTEAEAVPLGTALRLPLLGAETLAPPREAMLLRVPVGAELLLPPPGPGLTPSTSDW